MVATATPSPTRRRKPATTNPPDPSVKPFIEWFAREAEAVNKAPYAIEWARDMKLVNELRHTYSDRQLRELAWSLLHTQDEWHDRIGRTIPTLRRQANVLAERRKQTMQTWGLTEFPDAYLGLAAEVA